MMKRLWQLIIKGQGNTDVYDAASACNTLTSEALNTPTTIAMIDIHRSKGKFNCKSITGLKNMAQRRYYYAEGILSYVTLHPQSFLPEEIRMTQSDLIEYLPETTKPLWPDSVIAPLSEIRVADTLKTDEVER